jgi:hypothetical protein
LVGVDEKGFRKIDDALEGALIIQHTLETLLQFNTVDEKALFITRGRHTWT